MNETIDVQAPISEAIEESEVQADASDEPVENDVLPGADSEETLPCQEDLCPAVPQASDPDPCAIQENDAAARAEQLERELAELKQQIAARDAREARIKQEYDEFRALYPEVVLSDLPDTVFTSVEHGIPLAAAYALEERKKHLLTKKANASNDENRRLSSGSVNGTENLYFSPDEVRAMSREEIKHNYNRIIESMKSWH